MQNRKENACEKKFFLLQNAYDALIFFSIRCERNENFLSSFSSLGTGRKMIFSK